MVKSIYLTLKIKVSHFHEESEVVDFVLSKDTLYSVVPSKILEKLNITHYRVKELLLPNGKKAKRKVGDAYFELRGEGAMAPVVFGEDDDIASLGVNTLECIGLNINALK